MVALDFMMTLLQFLWRHAERTSNRIGIGFVIQRATQIHHHELMALIHQLLQLLHRDAGNPQFA